MGKYIIVSIGIILLAFIPSFALYSHGLESRNLEIGLGDTDKAQQYLKEAEHYNKKAEGYIRQADYYTRKKDLSRVNNYTSRVNDAFTKAKIRMKWAKDAHEKAQLRLKWAKPAGR